MTEPMLLNQGENSKSKKLAASMNDERIVLRNAHSQEQISIEDKSHPPKGPGRAVLPDRAIVALFPVGTQLANGLRHLSTCSILAEKSGRELLVDPSKSICAAFFARFLPSCFRQVNHDDLSEQCSLQHEESAYDFLSQDVRTNWHPIVEGSCNISKLESNRTAISSIYAIKPLGMRDSEYIRAKIEFYGKLKWVGDMKEKARGYIENMRATLEAGKVIGVHIRYTDNLHDENKKKAGLNTQLKDFLKILGHTVQRYKKDNKVVPLLVCSDNINVQGLVKKFLPHVYFPPMISRGRYLQALFEMLLLGSCDLIIGSTSSTFSYEAAFINGGTDIMLCHEGVWQTWHIGSV